MIDSRNFGLATSLALLAGVSLMGQSAPSSDVALRNWATPLYWQPNQIERENAGRSGAQIQFSGNATSNNALIFVAVSPCRLVDTRGASAGFIGSTPFNGPYIPAGGTATFPLQSTTETATTAPTPCGKIPTIAQAYSVNLTLVPHPLGTPVNYVTMWPDNGSAIPSVSTVNDQQGAVVANSAIVPAGTNAGGIKVFAYGATDVIIDMNGFYAAPTDVNGNTAVGLSALSSETPSGSYNTAVGIQALYSNTSGSFNTASGGGSLNDNTTGNNNTANGYGALFTNTAGNNNTASGSDALLSNTTGGANTANGASALSANTTGSSNTASGDDALQDTTTGSFNTASGGDAMEANTTGSNNTANGYSALFGNTTGGNNVAIGFNALAYNTTGGSNIAIGYNAGDGAPVGNSNSVYIGSQGFSYDASVIRLGAEGVQSATFIGGIYGSTVGGSAVYVNNVGQLSTTASSRRFKEQITDLGDASSKLFQLRPVSFFYKPEYDDGSHRMQYGLIAEEVEKIYPEMVDYEKDGRVHTVKYQFLAPMLLNELQKQNAEIERQKEGSQLQEERMRKLEEQNRSLEERLAALEALLSGGKAAVKSEGSQ